MAPPRLQHLWDITKLLLWHRRGLRSVEIARMLGLSRPTVDRRLEGLRHAGFHVVQERDGGHVRHRLLAPADAALRPSELQWSALLLASSPGSPLAGSELGAELEGLLAPGRASRGPTGAGASDSGRRLPRAVSFRRPHEVVIELDPGLASAAADEPLAEDQHIERRPDGSVRVRASVRGLARARLWVERWSGRAVVLAPPALSRIAGRAPSVPPSVEARPRPLQPPDAEPSPNARAAVSAERTAASIPEP
ncbi:MAG TPA: WYL domain-containing protein [Polyangiaceae bacterium]